MLEGWLYARSRRCPSTPERDAHNIVHMDILVEQVSLAETLELRWRVLRPHQKLQEVTLQGDEDPETIFYVARDASSRSVLATTGSSRACGVDLNMRYESGVPLQHR